MAEIINRIVRSVQHMNEHGIAPQRVELTSAAWHQLQKEMTDAGNALDADVVKGWPETIVGLPFSKNDALTYSAVVGNGTHGRVHVMV
ncbi:hypothetical protein D3C71_1104060 [compost metagenome]